MEMQFDLSILVEQVEKCPSWIGDQDGYLCDHKIEEPVTLRLPIEWMNEHDWKDTMTFDQKCNWLTDCLYHGDLYARLAEEYGQNPEDFIDCESCMDFRVIDYSEST